MEKETKIIQKTNPGDSKAWLPWLILGIIFVLVIGIILGIAARDNSDGPAEDIGEKIDDKIDDISSESSYQGTEAYNNPYFSIF